MTAPQAGRMNVALVACYGEKPPALKDLVAGMQAELGRFLGAAFVPYGMEQVHATIVGLEGMRVGDMIVNYDRGGRRRSNSAQTWVKEVIVGIAGP